MVKRFPEEFARRIKGASAVPSQRSAVPA
jgi:hypothetical protein